MKTLNVIICIIGWSSRPGDSSRLAERSHHRRWLMHLSSLGRALFAGVNADRTVLDIVRSQS